MFHEQHYLRVNEHAIHQKLVQKIFKHVLISKYGDTFSRNGLGFFGCIHLSIMLSDAGFT